MQAPDQALMEMLQQADAPFTLPLRCTTCGRTYTYEVKNVFVDPKQASKISAGQIIQCKGCSSIETYEPGASSAIALTAEMLRSGFLDKRQDHPDGDGSIAQKSPLIFQRPRIMAAGRRFETLGEAYWFLQGEIDKAPENGDLQRRMGNMLKNGERSDLALPHYFRAVDLNPHDAESYANIVDIFIGQARYEEAIPYTETLVQLCRDVEMDDDLRRGIFGELLAQTAVIEEKTKHRIDLFPKPQIQDPLEGEADGEKAPQVVYLTSLDVSNPNDFERMYEAFRTGRLPQASRQDPRATGRGGGTAVATPTEALFPPPVRTRQHKVGRNALCPCGSGKKYKRCCGR